MAKIIALLACLLLHSPAWGTYYWASSGGNNAATCGSIDSANVSTDPGSYGTIGQAARCATVAGDVVVVKAGTYTSTNHRIDTANNGNIAAGQFVSGTSESVRTMIIGDPAGARPVIRFAGSFYCTYSTVERHWITIKYLEIDGQNDDGCGSGFNITGQHVRLDDVILYNTGGSGVFFTWLSASDNTKSSFGEIINSVIHDVGLNRTSAYCVYAQSTDITISRSECYRAKGWGWHLYNGSTTVPPNRVTIERTYVHNILPGTQNFCGGMVVYGTGHIIRNNVVDITSTNCPSPTVFSGAIELRGTGASASFYNNTVQSIAGDGIRISSVATSATVKNNLFGAFPNGNAVVNSGSAALTSTHNACTSGQSCGSTGKVTISAITGCTPSTTVFTQKSGSSCVDTGTYVGYPYNGAAPDIGAFEVFTFASCEVPNGGASTIRVIFTSNANLLGSTLTTFTARLNGSDNALTGLPTKIGDTLLSFPVTTPYGGGDTVDWSWASGGFTDDARIGGTLNQPFLPVTNQSCTNNVGAATTYSLSQVTFQYRGLYGSETTTDIRGSENVASYDVVVNGALRVRIAVTNAVSNAPSIGLVLRYAKNGGSVTPVPAEFGADGVAMCGNRYPNIGVSTGADTTNQLSTAGTFVPGAVVLEALAIPTIAGLNVGYKTEMEYCVTWDATATGTFTFYLYEQTGAPLAAHTAVPTVIIVPPRAGTGF